MIYSNQYSEAISTVQLLPFSEGQWHRLKTYVPIPIDAPESTPVVTQTRPNSTRLNLFEPVDLTALKIEDALILDEIDSIKQVAINSAKTIRKENRHSQSMKYADQDKGRQTTSPTEEYERSTDFFYQTREPSSSYFQIHEIQSTNHSQLIPSMQGINTAFKDSLPTLINSARIDPSLKTQLHQSSQVRESTMAATADRRSFSPISVSSSRRAVGAISHQQRPRQYFRSVHVQTPYSNMDSNTHSARDKNRDQASIPTVQPLPIRQRSATRLSMHLLKTKNERSREQQKTGLKSILVKPCREPKLSDCSMNDNIPNSIEVLRRMGGPITPFEHQLRFNYKKQLNRFRNGSIQC